MKLKEINSEVFYADEDLIVLSKKTITDLEVVASKTIRKRARICTHKDQNDVLQEMFIIHYSETYVRPHYHLAKTESFHVISGEADVLIFDKEGLVTQRIELGEYHSGKKFYYRIGPGTIHSLLIKSDVFVFHESTLGPFESDGTAFPEWAPDGNDKDALAIFLASLKRV